MEPMYYIGLDVHKQKIWKASKCPHSSDRLVDYVEAVYLPFVQRTMKPSTYAAYKTYFERYIKPCER